MQLVLAGVTHIVTKAVFELYRTDEPQADWNLALTLEGPVPRFLLSGLVESALHPGPCVLEPEFIDDPLEATVDGRIGSLATSDGPSSLTASADGNTVRVEGGIQLAWCPFEEDYPAPEPYEVTLAVIAELQQR